MKLVITTSTGSLDGPYDPRFGRAQFFCLVDSESGEFEAMANPGIHASGGAGVQASQIVAEAGVEAVVSGHFGPKAHASLSAAGLRMFMAPAGEDLTGRELLERFQQGTLVEATGPGSPGRHGR